MDRGAWWATVHGGHKESGTTEQLTRTLDYQMITKLLWCKHDFALGS